MQQGNYVQTKKSKLNTFFSISYQKDFIIGKPQESNGLKELEAEYGQDRINFTFSRISIKSNKNLSQSMNSEVKYLRFGLEGSFVFPLNGAEGSSFDELINLEGQFYWKIPGTPSLIFHSSLGWLGHDYYNIYFNESTFIFRIGLAASIITGFGA